MEFKKAKRSLARLKIAIGGPSGSGKTMSSLLLAYGLIKAEHPNWSDAECWDKICIVDTENASGSLYVGKNVGSTTIGEYNAIDLRPPFEANKYIDAIKLAEDHNMSVVIIDSLSHAWSGEGGALDKQGKIAARTGNSYTAWRDIKPEQSRLLDAMLQSKCHVITDIRAKTDYVQTKDDRGKTVVKNVGLGLVYQDSIEYEFTVCFMLDADHVANATKDRTSLFDNKYFTITPETGAELYRWLTNGAEKAIQKPAPRIEKAEAPKDEASETETVTMDMVDKLFQRLTSGMTPDEKKSVAKQIKTITGGTANYKNVTDPAVLSALYHHFKENPSE